MFCEEIYNLSSFDCSDYVLPFNALKTGIYSLKYKIGSSVHVIKFDGVAGLPLSFEVLLNEVSEVIFELFDPDNIRVTYSPASVEYAYFRFEPSSYDLFIGDPPCVELSAPDFSFCSTFLDLGEFDYCDSIVLPFAAPLAGEYTIGVLTGNSFIYSTITVDVDLIMTVPASIFQENREEVFWIADTLDTPLSSGGYTRFKIKVVVLETVKTPDCELID